MPFQSIIKYVKYQSSSIGETGEGRFGFVPWYHYPGWILATGRAPSPSSS